MDAMVFHRKNVTIRRITDVPLNAQTGIRRMGRSGGPRTSNAQNSAGLNGSSPMLNLRMGRHTFAK